MKPKDIVKIGTPWLKRVSFPYCSIPIQLRSSPKKEDNPGYLIDISMNDAAVTC